VEIASNLVRSSSGSNAAVLSTIDLVINGNSFSLDGGSRSVSSSKLFQCFRFSGSTTTAHISDLTVEYCQGIGGSDGAAFQVEGNAVVTLERVVVTSANYAVTVSLKIAA
jgi:hypothetical protein